MGLLDRAGGFVDEIRCDESEFLIWKWHPRGSRKGSNTRENAIRWGSSLRVRDGSVAAFVYNKKDGSYQDFIEGPCDQILKTANLPVLASIVGLAYDGGTPFQAEVYFINLAQVVQIWFGVPYFDVFDPRFPDFGVPFAVRGTLTFCIKYYRQFIQLHRLDEFDLETFKQQVKDAIVRYVKGAVANAPAELDIPAIQLERAIAKMHDQIEPQVSSRLAEKFGVEVSGFDISAIEPDRASDGYRQLMAVTRDVEARAVQAQTEARIKDIHDQQRINVENLEESLRIQREEAQRAQRMATETTNIGAFQLEKQAEVGVAGASALGQMGANGATEVGSPGGVGSEGGSGWFDPAAMMAGMAVGGAVGQNIAGMMSGMMGGLGGRCPRRALPFLRRCRKPRITSLSMVRRPARSIWRRSGGWRRKVNSHAIVWYGSRVWPSGLPPEASQSFHVYLLLVKLVACLRCLSSGGNGRTAKSVNACKSGDMSLFQLLVDLCMQLMDGREGSSLWRSNLTL